MADPTEGKTPKEEVIYTDEPGAPAPPPVPEGIAPPPRPVIRHAEPRRDPAPEVVREPRARVVVQDAKVEYQKKPEWFNVIIFIIALAALGLITLSIVREIRGMRRDGMASE